GERGQHLLWKSHGRWRFKGVPQPQQIFEVGEPGIAPLRAPPSSPKAWRDIPLWRRPAALAAEAAVVAVIAVGLWFFMRPQPAIAFNERDWVVLADLRNLTGEPLLDDSLEQAFRISLEQSRHVNVLGDIKARKTLSRMAREPEDGLDRAVASELAIRDGARAVILPTVSEVGGRVRVSAEVIDPSTETTVYVAYADGRGTESVLESIDEVTATLREQLGEALEHVNEDSVPLPEVTTKNLDALKAYALAQEAEANRRWEEAIDLYQQAIELDAEFALAHMGMARILWSSIDYPAAQPHVDRAWELRESLPPRDRLYLDAWRAETAPEGTPLEEWTLLASMYPDYFAGSSNASWYLIVENRFEEALPYARAAAVPQDPLRAYPLDHVGRIHLAMGRPEEGLASFLLSEKESGGGAIRYRADALAVLGRHAEAREVLKSIKVEPSRPSSLYSHLERISIPLELGEFDEATGQADVAVHDASAAGGSQPEHFGLVRQMVTLASGNGEVSVVELERLADLAESRLMDAQGPRQHSHVFRMLVAAYVAQRSGHRKLAMDLTGKAEPHVRRLQHPNLHRMFGIVRGTSARLDGRPEDAIAILKEHVDGTEFVQTHVALHSAYIAAGRTAEAAAEAAWLSEHVGRAYVEVNMDQILQPLNVADVSRARGSRSVQ
ncbi:MAG: putative peptide modification system cyclase, partial [Xanthomonadales bacterium]|nr:putative peptide modification system cyclase [Xanthomonadales bacterium]